VIARRLGWIAVAAWPLPVHAHSPVPGIEGFYSGLLHPFSTPAQALLMIGLGLMAGGFEPTKARLPLGVFVATMVGGLMIGGVFEQPDMAMFASAFAACALSALAAGRLLPAAIAVAAAGGVCIGVVSLADPGPMRDRIITTLGAFTGASVGLLYLVGMSVIIRERYVSWTWIPTAFRVAAAWIGAVSLLMLALIFAPEQAQP
jgi:hypothetical protein